MSALAENPRVDRALRDEAFDHIDHALGRPAFPLRETVRNYFATEADGDLARAFMASPHWQLGGGRGGMAFFHVTEAGRAALARHFAEVGEAASVFVVSFQGHQHVVSARSAGKARYAVFLDIADCMADMTFGAFVRSAQVRRAAHA